MAENKFILIVKKIVSEEIRRQLPQLLDSVLTERYLKRILSENKQPQESRKQMQSP